MFIMPYNRDNLDDFSSPLERFIKGFDMGHATKSFMTTDILEKEDGLELTMDLPGIKKDDIKIELSDGYLTITASSNKETEEKNKQGNYIRKERQSGKYTRSFYVGSSLTQDDIKAKFEDGLLKVSFPKNQEKTEEKAKFIAIEG